MTPEEYAETVEIVEEDRGDMHCADWRVNREKTVANIAEAVRIAVAEEREGCANVAHRHAYWVERGISSGEAIAAEILLRNSL